MIYQTFWTLLVYLKWTKTIVKSLNDLYSIRKKKCFFDSIVELCINNNELKEYARTIKVDVMILNKINDADNFELF